MQTLYLRARLLRRRCGMLCGNRKKKSGRKDTPPRGGESWEAQEMRPKKRTNFECLAPGYSWD